MTNTNIDRKDQNQNKQGKDYQAGQTGQGQGKDYQAGQTGQGQNFQSGQSGQSGQPKEFGSKNAGNVAGQGKANVQESGQALELNKPGRQDRDVRGGQRPGQGERPPMKKGTGEEEE